MPVQVGLAPPRTDDSYGHLLALGRVAVLFNVVLHREWSDVVQVRGVEDLHDLGIGVGKRNPAARFLLQLLLNIAVAIGIGCCIIFDVKLGLVAPRSAFGKVALRSRLQILQNIAYS